MVYSRKLPSSYLNITLYFLNYFFLSSQNNPVFSHHFIYFLIICARGAKKGEQNMGPTPTHLRISYIIGANNTYLYLYFSLSHLCHLLHFPRLYINLPSLNSPYSPHPHIPKCRWLSMPSVVPGGFKPWLSFSHQHHIQIPTATPSYLHFKIYMRMEHPRHHHLDGLDYWFFAGYYFACWFSK
jgi:hypothetical protein